MPQLQASPAQQQAAASPLGGLGMGGGRAPMGSSSAAGQKLPPPPAKKDPFADLLG